MESRVAKLALAREKLKSHQEKKIHQTDLNLTELIQNNDNTISMSPSDACKKMTNDEEISQENVTKNTVREVNPSVSQSEVGSSTEALIFSKRNLELEIKDLQNKISHLEKSHEVLNNNNKITKQQNIFLETELSAVKDKVTVLNEQLLEKDQSVDKYKSMITLLQDEKNNLQEQLDFNRILLTTKETENSFLNSEIIKLQKQLEATDLRLQQLTNGQKESTTEHVKNIESEQNELLLQKISQLELQLKNVQKERDQMNSHYEHYISELNEELKSAVKRNEDLVKESENLSARENNLIEQISNMEVQLQNFRSNQQNKLDLTSDINITELQERLSISQDKLQNLQTLYDETQQKLYECEMKMKEMEVNDGDADDDISMSKLHADITNDKIAAQRATEQNVKLKSDLQELEEAFIKMSKDKLELTEKLEAEKFLNRELTIKLAENVEIANNVQVMLKAKDNEMIRIQNNYREIEKKFEQYSQIACLNNEKKTEIQEDNESITADDNTRNLESTSYQHHHNHCTSTLLVENESKEIGSLIAKEDAMLKLQDRFLKIMSEVADLSDEKHRLEHIIMQLQNETDTICEYVALYQQQRSLLKHRDEERSAQIKIFQSECEKMKMQLNKLNEIIIRIINDEELTTYFRKEERQNDISNIFNILNNMKTNFLVDSSNKYAEMHNFYPCACCSGNIIDL